MKFVLHRITEGQSYQRGFNLKTGIRYRGEDLEWTREKILPVKGEGLPIEMVEVSETPKPGAKPLGSWWSFGYHTGNFLVQFRWRSWTYPLIFIGRDMAGFSFEYFTGTIVNGGKHEHPTN